MFTRALGIVALAILPCVASAQQPAATPAAPPPTVFAPSDLSPNGVRALASANCAACHGTHGKSQRGSSVPALAGRPQQSLIIAMQEFKDGKRTATLMHQIAKGYSAEEIAALGDYFANQKP